MSLAFKLYLGIVIAINVATLVITDVMQNMLLYSTWTLISQIIYFAFELLVLKNNDRTKLARRYFINIITVPSVLSLMYYLIEAIFKWEENDILVDLLAQGVNVFHLSVFVLYFYPFVGTLYEPASDTPAGILQVTRKKIREIAPFLLAFVVPLAYGVTLIVYTASTHHLVYQTNLFGFDTVEKQPPYGIEMILLSFYFVVFLQGILSYVCNERLKSPYFAEDALLVRWR